MFLVLGCKRLTDLHFRSQLISNVVRLSYYLVSEASIGEKGFEYNSTGYKSFSYNHKSMSLETTMKTYKHAVCFLFIRVVRTELMTNQHLNRLWEIMPVFLHLY